MFDTKAKLTAAALAAILMAGTAAPAAADDMRWFGGSKHDRGEWQYDRQIDRQRDRARQRELQRQRNWEQQRAWERQQRRERRRMHDYYSNPNRHWSPDPNAPRPQRYNPNRYWSPDPNSY